MGGKKIYIGDMLDDLITNMQSLSGKMDQNVTLLNTVSLNTSQAINTLNVVASENMKLLFPAGSVVRSYTNLAVGPATEYVDCFKFLSRCNGVIRIRLSCSEEMTRNNTTSTDNYYIIVDVNGTEYSMASLVSTAGATGSKVTTPISSLQLDVPVKAGDAVTIRLKVVTASGKNPNQHVLTFSNAAVFVGYDITNIVQSGGLIMVL